MSPLATLAMILGAAVVVGLLLSLPFLRLVARSRRKGAMARSPVLTRSGALMAIPMAAGLLAFFAWPSFDPEAPEWVSSWWARMGAAVLIGFVSIPIDLVLARRGYPTSRPRNDRIDGPPAA